MATVRPSYLISTKTELNSIQKLFRSQKKSLAFFYFLTAGFLVLTLVMNLQISSSVPKLFPSSHGRWTRDDENFSVSGIDQ